MYRKRSATTKTVPCRTSIASIPIKRPNCKEALTQILSKHVSAMRFRVICSLLNESLIYVDSGWTRQPFLGNVCNRRNRYLLMFGERLVFEVRIVAVRIVRVIYVFVMLIKIRFFRIRLWIRLFSSSFLHFLCYFMIIAFSSWISAVETILFLRLELDGVWIFRLGSWFSFSFRMKLIWIIKCIVKLL